MKLFQDGKPFFKGNLHCHTTLSDGRRSPEEVISLYRDKGYDFLALTDHRRLSQPAHMEGTMLLLPGIEMDYMLACEALHLIGIGMDAGYEYKAVYRQGPQATIDHMKAHGGRVILAHPAWSLNTLSTLSALRGLTAAEIYNSVSTYPWNGDRANSSAILDVALTHGVPFRFVASDDSHFYNGEAGRSFTMVQADALTQESLFAALDEGRFYASQGPQFHQITMENGQLALSCSPVDTIIFYSNLVWSNGRCITGNGLTQAAYDLTASSGETFVRIQIIDSDGNSAWSNPVFL